MRKVSEIISLYPNSTVLGHVIGMPASAVRAMKSREIIPLHYWQALVEDARKRKLPITYWDLLCAHIPAAKSERKRKL